MKIKVPGKLFVAGEYSIMTKDNNAILVAVSKFLYVEIKESKQYSFESDQGYFKWMLDDGIPVFDYSVLSYAKSAIFMAHKYLKQHKIEPLKYEISVESELEENGIKYGLGSSGAVLVGVLKAILDLHNVKYTKEQLFKLAVLSQIEIQQLSSGGDLAACIYTGWVYYKKYDFAWLYQKDRTDLSIIYEEWPNLEIEPLNVLDYDLLIGWTGTPSSSLNAISLLEKKDMKDQWYLSFLNQANIIVNRIRQDILNPKNLIELNKHIGDYQALLLTLETWADIPIQTEKLDKLVKCANDLNLVGKISGSGNGDCGIVIVNKNESTHIKEKLYDLWRKNGILPMEFNVWSDKDERN